MRNTRKDCPDAWRLPAEPLEQAVAQCIAKHLSSPSVQSTLFLDATVSETANLIEAINDLTGTVTSDLIALATRVDISPGFMTIALDAEALSSIFELQTDRINADHLIVEAPFQLRRRGVETKIILGSTQINRDETLMRAIAVGHKYLDLIKAGNTYDRVAQLEGTSKRMVQHQVEYAFLAPDIVEDIYNGNQPTGLTTDWLKKRTIPMDWDQQRQMIAGL